MKMTPNEILNLYKINDTIIITKQPSVWSSTINGNYPLRKVRYPYKCKIKKIVYSHIGPHVAISDEKYGWSLSAIINENCIEPIEIKKRYRLKKLDKIYKNIQ